jgi:hypothetical protein
MSAGLSLIPVPPIRTGSGALASLIGPLTEGEATPSPFTGHVDALGAFSIEESTMSLSAAVSLGYGAFFSGSGSGMTQAFYLDAMAFSDQYEEHGAGSAIIATRWGSGLRVLVKATDVKLDLSLNLGLVAAAAKLGYARTAYKVEGYGVGGVDGLQIVLGEMAGAGEFTFETYEKITGPIAKKMADYLVEHKTTLAPAPVAVALARSIDPIATARSIYHAMDCIYDRMKLGDALQASPGIDLQTVRLVYEEVAQVTDDDSSPSSEARAVAEDWFKTRR